MPTFEWRRYKTRHFGESWQPIAEIEFRAADGQFQQFAFLIDSGAVVTLARRSVGDLLGVPVKSGRAVDVGGVGGARVNAFVHHLPVRFDGQDIDLPVAIADSESVPNLLGRVGFFDRLQVRFDPGLAETSVWPAWLDAREVRLWRWFQRIERRIIENWYAYPFPSNDPETRIESAPRQLFSQAQRNMCAVTVLMQSGARSEMRPLLRGLLEIDIQLGYLLAADSDRRALLYLEFEHVERYRLLQAALKATGPLARKLTDSDARPAGEAAAKNAFERAQRECPELFTAQGKPRDSWHGKNASDLAQSVGLHADYLTWYKQHSGSTHASSFDIDHEPKDLFWLAATFFASTLRRIAKGKQIPVSVDDMNALNRIADGLRE